MKRLISGALALAFVLAGAGHAAEPPTVKIQSGLIAGADLGDIVTFRGVPFAAPPVGDLRWAPPKPVAAWSGARATTQNGSACLQNRGSLIGAEDCLYLNVFAPKAAKKAPVMVWIHGGSNTGGSGGNYDGSAFARNGIVLVTINYRLGAMGFFAHPSLTKAAGKNEALSNFALMDQIAALQWVKRNAAAFGGDAGNVTVFGESAGAMDIFALLGIPSTKGLYNRAILESNIGWGGASTLQAKEAGGVQLAAGLGLTGDITPAQLRALPADKVMAAQNRAGVAIDGRLVKESTFSAFDGGRQVKVPTLVGSNSYEASLIAGRAGSTPEQLNSYSDSAAGAPARFIARRQAESGQPAWLYFFSYVREASRATAPGAAHASEIPYVFKSFAARGNAAAATPPSAQDQEMANLIHSCWVAFAKGGKPACASGPAWPQYTATGDQLMEFGAPSGVRTNFRKATLDVIEARQTRARTTP